MSEPEVKGLVHYWRWWARAAQWPPDGQWRTWLVLAGRGFGKTRTGAEWVRLQIAAGRRRIALVAPTAADVRDVMVEGESGILAISPPWDMPRYEPSKRRITWSNGAIATTYSADEPERLRGPQHDAAWSDELASWRYPDAWDMLMFGLRLGTDPRCVVTTTPKPIKILKDLLADPNTVVSRGSTYANAANLAGAFLDQIVRKYEGTRLGRQELNAEVLDDVPGALWTRKLIEEARWPWNKSLPEFSRVVVAIDPAASMGEDSDETGIIVAAKGRDGYGYVLADKSGRYHPMEWARIAVGLYREHQADRIVAEVNNGGDMVGNTIKMIDQNVSYSDVRATRGKVVRAEPVAMLYEQHRVFHTGGFAELEDQMCFPAGTLIETARGHVAIEDVTPNDLVLTRNGYSPIELACKTGRFSQFVVIESTDGRILKCTANHPIYDAGNHRFVPAKNVFVGQRLAVRPSPESLGHRLPRGGDGITECRAAIIRTQKASCLTVQFGKRISAQYRKGIMSIMRTVTLAITSLGTSNRYLRSRTSQDIRGLGSQSSALSDGRRTRKERGIVESGWSSPALSAAPPGRPHTRRAANSVTINAGTDSYRRSKLGWRLASNVARYFQQEIRGGFTAVARVTTAHTTPESVYNLAVRHAPEYYANGILVHNCSFTSDFDRKAARFSPDRVDALVWALTELCVETSPHEGYLQWLRNEAEARKPKPPPAPQVNYAFGSVEWMKQNQERLQREREERGEE